MEEKNSKEVNDQKRKYKPIYDSEHEFIPRKSYFDTDFEDSILNTKEFKGFVNLSVLLLVLYLMTTPIYNFIIHGTPIQTGLIERMVRDFKILIFVWPVFHFWTYFSFFLQVLIKNGIPYWASVAFQHCTQTLIFVITTIICLKGNMCVTHNMFTLFQCMIHFFKMHSYTVTNRDFRENYLQSKKNENIERISSYPNNINFKNFFYFLLCPTFVYQESYPQTEKFRIKYFTFKVLKAFLSLITLYYIYTEHVEAQHPHMLEYSYFTIIAKIYIPLTFMILVGFFMVFECVLNGYAEIATFADRQFYIDWWNSTDFEQFNRRWNKIVHEFLYRHVYIECIRRYKLTKSKAQFITFLFSAFLHEYCLWMIFKVIRPFLLGLMLIQIPLIYFGKKFLKNSLFGNYFFWFSIILGNSLLFVFYWKAHYLEFGIDSKI